MEKRSTLFYDTVYWILVNLAVNEDINCYDVSKVSLNLVVYVVKVIRKSALAMLHPHMANCPEVLLLSISR